ncbi:MAG: PRC-barrel domain-containing protein [Ktedonobacteraceae bacterium]
MEENIQATRKWSDLRGIAVVSLSDGRKVGTCDDFYFDLTTHRVHALGVKTGVFGHKILLATSISAIGRDAITTPNEEGLRSKLKDGQVPKLASGEALRLYRVMSASGVVVGTVGNVLLDSGTPAALSIAAFELAGGLREKLGGHYPTFPASQVLRYGQDVLVVPDELAQTLH